MKKIVILFIAIIVSLSSFAQRIKSVTAEPVQFFDQHNTFQKGNPDARTTALGDTLILHHITSVDTLATYKVGSADSGYVTGTNYWQDQAFAERYDYTDDSGKNMQVIGVFAMFGGKVAPASSKSVVFTIWDEGPQQVITSTSLYRGFPNEVVDTLTIPITQLGIGTTTDTLKSYLFSVDSGLYFGSFFAGYSISYDFTNLGGDTIGLASNLNGDRTEVATAQTSYLIDPDSEDTLAVATDTIYTVQNATLGSDNNWYDNYTQNDSLLNNLAIYPIIMMGYTASVKGVKKNNLTFFGNYPNPATDQTNIKFSLAAGADVTVQITDMAGRTVNTIKQNGLSAGEHIVAVNISGFPAGDYLYLIRTSQGDGMAGKMTKE